MGAVVVECVCDLLAGVPVEGLLVVVPLLVEGLGELVGPFDWDCVFDPRVWVVAEYAVLFGFGE